MAFWNKRCHRPVFQPPMLTSRARYALHDQACTKAARHYGLLPCAPDVPAQVDRINAATVQMLLAQIAEVSHERR
jgi:hypothetical protein